MPNRIHFKSLMEIYKDLRGKQQEDPAISAAEEAKEQREREYLFKQAEASKEFFRYCAITGNAEVAPHPVPANQDPLQTNDLGQSALGVAVDAMLLQQSMNRPITLQQNTLGELLRRLDKNATDPFVAAGILEAFKIPMNGSNSQAGFRKVLKCFMKTMDNVGQSNNQVICQKNLHVLFKAAASLDNRVVLDFLIERHGTYNGQSNVNDSAYNAATATKFASELANFSGFPKQAKDAIPYLYHSENVLKEARNSPFHGATHDAGAKIEYIVDHVKDMPSREVLAMLEKHGHPIIERPAALQSKLDAAIREHMIIGKHEPFLVEACEKNNVEDVQAYIKHNFTKYWSLVGGRPLISQLPDSMFTAALEDSKSQISRDVDGALFNIDLMLKDTEHPLTALKRTAFEQLKGTLEHRKSLKAQYSPPDDLSDLGRFLT